MILIHRFAIAALCFLVCGVARSAPQAQEKSPSLSAMRMVGHISLDLPKGEIDEIKISRNGKIAAVKVGGRLVTFNAKTWKRLHEFSPNLEAAWSQFALSPDGQQIAFVHYKEPNSVSMRSGITLEVCNAADGQIKRVLLQSDYSTFVEFSPDGKQLAAFSTLSPMVAGEEKKQVLRCWTLPDFHLKWSRSDELTPSSSNLNPLYYEVFIGNIFYSGFVVFSPDNRLVATTTEGIINLWSTNAGEKTATLTDKRGAQPPLVFSPDGKTLASGGDTASYGWYAGGNDETSPYHATALCSVKLWNLKKRQLQTIFHSDKDKKAFTYIYYPLAFWPNNKTLLAMSYETPSGPTFFDAKSKKETGRQELPFSSRPIAITVSPDGRFLLIASNKTPRPVLDVWQIK